MKSCGILDIIAPTLICLDRFSTGTVFGKAEFLNPGASINDRIAKATNEDAEARDVLKPGATIFEATSGNTDIGLSFVGVQGISGCHRHAGEHEHRA